MDIDEFVSKVQPGKKVSRLKQYEQQIGALKAKGYTDDQIRQWLAENNVVVSREAVRRFAKKILHPASSTNADELTVQDISKNINESQAAKLQRRLAEQKKDARSTLFKHDKSGKQTE